MQPYNYPDSDIDETEMIVKVRCTACRQVREEKIIREDLGDLTQNEDGTYTDLTGECATCLENQQLRKLVEDYYAQVAIGQRLEDATPQDIEQYERDMDALQKRAEGWLATSEPGEDEHPENPLDEDWIQPDDA